jgi:hypothetical protein
VKRQVDIRQLLPALFYLLEASLPLACRLSTEPIQSRLRYSAASIKGTYEISAAAKPYVKFAGGPRIGSGTIHFDGRGNLDGTQTWYGDNQSLHGTYVVSPDGEGFATVVAKDSSGVASPPSEIEFQIVNPDKIQFESRGLASERSGEDLDWASATYCQQTANPCASGVMTRE